MDKIESDKMFIISPSAVVTIRPKHPPSRGLTRWHVRLSCGCKMVSTIVSLANSVMMGDDQECVRCGKADCAVTEYYPKKKEPPNASAV